MGILIGVFVEEFVRGLTWVGDFAWGFFKGILYGGLIGNYKQGFLT